MDVILKEDIRSVGKAGEVVRVKEGYARNYLFPQKKAMPVTPANLKRLEVERVGIEAKRARLREEAEKVARELANLTVVLEREAGEEEKIFGSITARQLAEAVNAKGITIDHRKFHLKEPIRKLGSYSLEVHLHGDVIAPLSVEVRRK